MAARPVAVVGLSGQTLRYAEVLTETPGDPRLRRLGAADFDRDAEVALFSNADSGVADDVGGALLEGFRGSDAQHLVVALHPTHVTSFFTPLPAGLDEAQRDGQLRQEAALLADLAPTQVVRAHSRRIREEAAPSGDRREWFQTAHVSEPVHASLTLISDALGMDRYTVVESTRAVAIASPTDGVSLVVGAYERHTEVAVARDGVYLFGTHGPSTAPADTAYFALAALQQAGAAGPDVDHLLVYGDDVTDQRLELVVEFVGVRRSPLDPFAHFGRRPSADPAELAAFGPVLGAALDAGL